MVVGEAARVRATPVLAAVVLEDLEQERLFLLQQERPIRLLLVLVGLDHLDKVVQEATPYFPLLPLMVVVAAHQVLDLVWCKAHPADQVVVHVFQVLAALETHHLPRQHKVVTVEQVAIVARNVAVVEAEAHLR